MVRLRARDAAPLAAVQVNVLEQGLRRGRAEPGVVSMRHGGGLHGAEHKRTGPAAAECSVCVEEARLAQLPLHHLAALKVRTLRPLLERIDRHPEVLGRSWGRVEG